jgi:ParB/RepB/Spo0J family partition protein
MNEIVQIPLVYIVASKLNPRKTINQDSIIELSQSIKSVGLLQPITVRKIEEDDYPTNDVYEVIMGYRRYCACSHLGMTTMPCIIVEMDDEEVLDAMIIENLQRQDIEPMDEARAFANLNNKGWTGEDIAVKVGKPVLFVMHRIRLLELIAEFVKMFDENELSISHAYELCKLDKDIQLDIYKTRYSEEASDYYRWNDLNLKDLKSKIQNLAKNLDNASFSLAECITCQFCTSIHGSLFPDYKINSCTNSFCYDDKIFEHRMNNIILAHEEDTTIMIRSLGTSNRVLDKLKELHIPVVVFSTEEYDFEHDKSDDLSFHDKMVKKGFEAVYGLDTWSGGDKMFYIKAKITKKDIAAAGTVHPELIKLDKDLVRKEEIKEEKINADLRSLISGSNYREISTPLLPIEETAFMAVIFYMASNSKLKEIRTKFKKDLSYMENIQNMLPEDIITLKRCFIKQCIVGTEVTHDADVQNILSNISNVFYSDKFGEIVEEHTATCNKRKDRIAIRKQVILDELNPVKKELVEKKTVSLADADAQVPYIPKQKEENEYVKFGNIGE